MRVVVDAMGSDLAPAPEVAGALGAARAIPIEVILVGDSARLEAELVRAGATADDRVSIVHAAQAITMDDHPAHAYRAKPESSLRVAIEQVAAGQGDAVVSAGNSGAILACALFGMGRLPGIDRPAIVTVLPSPSGPLVLCDSGANTEPKPAAIAQFGVLAAAYDRIVHGRERPRLGLLSNGAEPGKGTPLTREAHQRLLEAAAAAPHALQYIGYVEGSDLFRGVVDAIATDGFTGNVVLKTCEGIAEGLFGMVRQELEQSLLARLGSAPSERSERLRIAERFARRSKRAATLKAWALVAPALRGVAKRIDYTEVGGALLAGVTRPVVIAHGRSDAAAIASAIRAAADFAERRLPDQLAAALHPRR